MKVYCVFVQHEFNIYNSEWVLLKVFDSEQTANNYVENRKKQYNNNFAVEEHELE